jgi:hypothetical protein
MFLFSIKADKRKIIMVLAVLLVAVTLGIVLGRIRTSEPTAECEGVKYSLKAGTNEERVSFLAQFGWSVDTEPLEIKDVTIPETFTDVYENYNNIQKQQGLDLKPYAGKTCRQWVYAVKNYPQNPDVRATLLVYNNIVIGGDLCTAALDGFMTGFRGEQASDDYSNMESMASSSVEEAAPKVSSAIPANAWPTD